jgi:hypothetical protein
MIDLVEFLKVGLQDPSQDLILFGIGDLLIEAYW